MEKLLEELSGVKSHIEEQRRTIKGKKEIDEYVRDELNAAAGHVAVAIEIIEEIRNECK